MRKAVLIASLLAGARTPVRGNSNGRGKNVRRPGAVSVRTGNMGMLVPSAANAYKLNRQPVNLTRLPISHIQNIINRAKKAAITSAKANLPPNLERPKVPNRVFKNATVNNRGPYTFKNTIASLRRRLAHVRKSKSQHKTILIKTTRFENAGETMKGAQKEFASREMNKKIMNQRENTLKELGILRNRLEQTTAELLQKTSNRGLMLKPSENNVSNAGKQALQNLNRMRLEMIEELNAPTLALVNKSVNKSVTSGLKPDVFLLQAQTFVNLLDNVDLKRDEVKIQGNLEGQIKSLMTAVNTAKRTNTRYLMAHVESAINITVATAIPTDMLDLSQADLNYTKMFVNSTLERPKVWKVIKYLAPGWLVPDEGKNCLIAAIAYSICGALCPTQERFIKIKEFLFHTSAVMWYHGNKNTWYSRDIGSALVILKVSSLTAPMPIRAVSKLLLSIPMTPVRMARGIVRHSVRNSLIGSLVPIILFASIVSKAGGTLDTILYALDLTILFYQKLNT